MNPKSILLIPVLILSLWSTALRAEMPIDSVRLREMVFTGTLKEMRKDDFAIPVEI